MKNANGIYRSFLLLLAGSCMFGIISCSKDNDNTINYYDRIQPSKPKPAWAPGITKQMQAVIETLDTIALNPIHTLTPQQARQQPSAADAAMRVMTNFSIPAPQVNVDTVGTDIPVNGGTVHLRIYTPRTGKSSYPVIVYCHGGGWVIATNDTYRTSAEALSQKADAVLVSVEYRKGPEYKFPTAHNDAFAAYRWALANAAGIKGNAAKIAVAGESAGGNMAITVSMMARDSGIQKPVHILSVYPVASNDPNTPSKLQYTTAKPLSTPDLPWFLSYDLNNQSESASPLINLVGANLTGFPKTTIIAAELDPLQSEGKTLSDRLQAAGVSVTCRLYTGVTHEFFGMGAVIPEATMHKTWRPTS